MYRSSAHSQKYGDGRRNEHITRKENENFLQLEKSKPEDLSRMNSFFISLNGFAFTVNSFDVIYLRQTNKRNR